MPQIIISNKSNIPRAEIITIVSDDHVLSKNESMQTWIASGESAETWNRFTSIVKITDRTLDELQYLLEPVMSNVTAEPEIIHGRKWYFSEPDIESEFYQSLFSTGEVTATYDEMLPYLVERT